jgi:hypothetical protein
MKKARRFFCGTELAARRFSSRKYFIGEREPFLAIDPKGIVGDIGFEISVFLNNPRGWLLSNPDRKRKS